MTRAWGDTLLPTRPISLEVGGWLTDRMGWSICFHWDVSRMRLRSLTGVDMLGCSGLRPYRFDMHQRNFLPAVVHVDTGEMLRGMRLKSISPARSGTASSPTAIARCPGAAVDPTGRCGLHPSSPQLA